MNWYISKLIFRIVDHGSSAAQFDEQWRMIHAASEREALATANQIGRKESEQILKSNGQSVRWEFICVTDLHPFTHDLNGAELFSRIEQPDNEYLYLLSNKAKAQRYPENEPLEA